VRGRHRLLAAPAEIDTMAYTGAIDPTNSIRLVSGVASLGSVAGSSIFVSKDFVPVPEHGAVDVTYTLANTSPSDSITLAPWHGDARGGRRHHVLRPGRRRRDVRARQRFQSSP
jgi:hypothetical protein